MEDFNDVQADMVEMELEHAINARNTWTQMFKKNIL